MLGQQHAVFELGSFLIDAIANIFPIQERGPEHNILSKKRLSLPAPCLLDRPSPLQKLIGCRDVSLHCTRLQGVKYAWAKLCICLISPPL